MGVRSSEGLKERLGFFTAAAHQVVPHGAFAKSGKLASYGFDRWDLSEDADRIVQAAARLAESPRAHRATGLIEDGFAPSQPLRVVAGRESAPRAQR